MDQHDYNPDDLGVPLAFQLTYDSQYEHPANMSINDVNDKNNEEHFSP